MRFRRWHALLWWPAARRQPQAMEIRYAQATAWEPVPQADSSAEPRAQGAMVLRCSEQGVRPW